MCHQYAVKYIDKNGSTISYGYIETMCKYNSGDIITMWNGARMKIDFEM